MGDSGYRGVSAAQDGRFGNKDRKLIKQLENSGSFPPTFNKKVDLRKVSLQVLKPWIENKLQELLGFEDDVVVEYVMGQLESEENQPFPDPRKMQVSLLGFLDSSTAPFMSELWSLLLSAQESVGGIPREFVEKKKEEMRLAREKDQNAIRQSGVSASSSSRPLPPRPSFRPDKASFDRARDAGWGNRTRPPPPPSDEDQYSYRRRPDYRNHSDRRDRHFDRLPPRRDDASRRRESYERAQDHRMRVSRPEYDRRSRSRSRSQTPSYRSYSRSRSRSRSYSPPAQNRNRDSSRDTHARTRDYTPRRRSHSRDHTPRLERHPGRSRSRSRSPSRYRRRNYTPSISRTSRSRSRSRSISPRRSLRRRSSRSISRSPMSDSSPIPPRR
ncbi:unnamed protein product [Sympodiomycopsis kandeliae]